MYMIGFSIMTIFPPWDENEVRLVRWYCHDTLLAEFNLIFQNISNLML